MRNFVGMTLWIVVVLVAGGIGSAEASEPLVIAGSPSLATPLEALSRAFETIPPECKGTICISTQILICVARWQRWRTIPRDNISSARAPFTLLHRAAMS